MDELVRGFVEGQVSRRVFVRRLVAAGVALTGAVAYADLLQANPAAALEYHAVYVQDYAFSASIESLSGPGDYVNWDWDPTAGGHTVTDTSGSGFFDSSPYPNGFDGWSWVTAFGHEFWASGTWPYHCKDAYHTDGVYMSPQPMTGTIRVPMVLSSSSGRVGKIISVWFGAVDLTSNPGFLYEVQLRKPGASWIDWVVDGTAQTKNYKVKLVGTHRFRARLRNTTLATTSGWSPVAKFTAR